MKRKSEKEICISSKYYCVGDCNVQYGAVYDSLR